MKNNESKTSVSVWQLTLCSLLQLQNNMKPQKLKEFFKLLMNNKFNKNKINADIQ
jgi:hypothetical protein